MGVLQAVRSWGPTAYAQHRSALAAGWAPRGRVGRMRLQAVLWSGGPSPPCPPPSLVWPCRAPREGFQGLPCGWNTLFPRRSLSNQMPAGKDWAQKTSSFSSPCTPVPWSHLGQMGREPGREFGNMLEARCCRRAVPSQVNKLHTKHKQSAACLSPLRGRRVPGSSSISLWAVEAGPG